MGYWKMLLYSIVFRREYYILSISVLYSIVLCGIFVFWPIFLWRLLYSCPTVQEYVLCALSCCILQVQQEYVLFCVFCVVFSTVLRIYFLILILYYILFTIWS